MNLIEVAQNKVGECASVLAFSIVAMAATIVFVENWLIYPLLLAIGAWIFRSVQLLKKRIDYLKHRKGAHTYYQTKILESLLKVQANQVVKCVKRGNPGYDQKRELAELCAIIVVSYPKMIRHFEWFLTKRCFQKDTKIYTHVEYIEENHEMGEFVCVSLVGEELCRARLL